MIKLRLYQILTGDVIEWMGMHYRVTLTDKLIKLRRNDQHSNHDHVYEFGRRCKMWVLLVKRKNPETVGEFIVCKNL